MLFTFEELSNILNLQAEDIIIDKLCYSSAFSTIEKYLQYKLEDKNYNELQTVIDNKIYLNQINISEVINITDMNTKEKIENCVIDYINKAILFLTCKYDNHVLFINYNAGFTAETFPTELKEAITKLFIIKKNNLLNNLNNPENKDDLTIPEDIKMILDVYKKKVL